MKKKIALGAFILAAGMALSLAGCGEEGGNLKAAVEHKIADDGIAVIVSLNTTLDNVTFNDLYHLYIDGTAIGDVTKAVGREAASGTRGAFHELVKSSDGKTIDAALKEGKQLATVVSESSSTDAVLTQVSGASDTLGYVSLSSALKHPDKVKLLKLDGTEATAANVANGTYKLARPFNLVWTEEGYKNNDLAQNFVSFIESTAGQEIITAHGCIVTGQTAGNYTVYTGSKTVLKIGGSTSVDPLMKKFIEAYRKLNPNVTIQETANGSGEGITGARNGTYDLGMSSRALKAEEKTAE